jgi:hypothetical protein
VLKRCFQTHTTAVYISVLPCELDNNA